MRCGYRYFHGEGCPEEALSGSDLCALHAELPEDERGEAFRKARRLKEEMVEAKVKSGDFNFEGARLYEVDLSGQRVGCDLNLADAEIRTDARFEGADIQGDVLFSGVRVGRTLWFKDARIGGDAWFQGARIERLVSFVNARVEGLLLFDRSVIEGDLLLVGARIERDAEFDRARIKGEIALHRAEARGRLSFKGATFESQKSQEVACRKAKTICEMLGDREDSDHYFYREMEAKRRQKGWINRHLELPIQYVFGYGTRWEWPLVAWFLVVFGFAFLYWGGNGVVDAKTLLENIYFSIVTVTTIGYGDYHPKKGIFQMLAGTEALFGTFMWAVFVAIFARKYMR